VKCPMVRGRLLKAGARRVRALGPVGLTSITSSPAPTARLPGVRGLGGFVRSSWDEVNEIVAAPTSTRSSSTVPTVYRLLAHSRHVDGELCGRQPLSQPHRRRVHELL
jgi:hypothetical protein